MMLTALLIITTMPLGFAGSEEGDLREAVVEPVLAPGTTLDELKAFVRKRVPVLSLPDSAETWDRQAQQLRTELLERVVFQGVPSAWRTSPVNVVWSDVIETDHRYRIRKLRYEAAPGLWIPAVLYEPASAPAAAPAVLNVNGHIGPPGKAHPEEQARSINLAKRGVYALHPEWFSFGELQGDGFGHGRAACLDLCGVSGLSLFYLALSRAVDVLETLPGVDTGRIAMTGLSGGGWQTIVLGALDIRVSVIVPNAGYIDASTRLDFQQDIGDFEQIPADMLAIADYTHLTAMLAPRPALLIYNDKDDCCFESYRARPSVFDPIVPAYALFGRAEAFAYHENTDPGTHNYQRDNREQLYGFLNLHFGLDEPSGELPFEDEMLPDEALYAGVPRDNHSFTTLARELSKDLPRTAVPPDESVRRELRSILRVPNCAVEVAAQESIERDGVSITRYALATGEWTLPAVLVGKTDDGGPLTVLIADAGREAALDAAVSAVEVGGRALLVDPLYLGEAVFSNRGNHQYGMFVHSVGERLLGIQTAQTAAVLDWARAELSAASIALKTIGWNAGLAGLAAAALRPGIADHIRVRGGLDTLKRLLEREASYESHLPLFCFGLLATIDVGGLVDLCQPALVEFHALGTAQ